MKTILVLLAIIFCFCYAQAQQPGHGRVRAPSCHQGGGGGPEPEVLAPDERQQVVQDLRNEVRRLGGDPVDEEFPVYLTTGRVVSQYLSGTQTRRIGPLVEQGRFPDGVAIVNTNDLAGGMRRIANDIRAYYVLGYYTTNTKFDGGVRTIGYDPAGNVTKLTYPDTTAIARAPMRAVE